MSKEYTRTCPGCQAVIVYTTKQAYNRGVDRNSLCKKSCLYVTEEVRKIIDLAGRGFRNYEIDRDLCLTRGRTAYILQKFKVGSAYKRPKATPVDENSSICAGCGEVVPHDRFEKISGTTRYRAKCLDCRYSDDKKSIVSTEFNYFQYRIRISRRTAREKNLEFNLTTEHLLDLWVAQKNRCFYTDVGLLCDKETTPLAVSVDRIDPAKGYIIGNIVLCARRINTIKNDTTPEEMKQWMPGWYRKIVRWQKKNGYPTFEEMLTQSEDSSILLT